MSLNSSIKTTPYGGNGGSSFEKQVIKEIGLRTGSRVDQIKINGVAHGGNGGGDKGSITLTDEEYISEVNVRSGSEVDYVNFTTNKGNAIGGGGSGGGSSVLENIRVIAIGGRSGSRVDKLDIMYIEDYEPSVIEESHVGFILDYTAPFYELHEYESSVLKTVDSYEKITKSMLGQTYSASVEGEFFVKVAASTEIKVENTELVTVHNELQNELSKGSSKTITVKEGYVGILLVQGNLMKGADEKRWMYPTSEVSYSVIKIEDTSNVLGHYDLTGELYTQMPGLKVHKTTKNGFIFYGDNQSMTASA